MPASLSILPKWRSLFTWTLPGAFLLSYKVFIKLRYMIPWHTYRDLFRPDRHIPLHSGPPAAYPGGVRQHLYRVQPPPQPAFSNPRVHTCGDLLIGFGQPPPPPLPPGHDAAFFNPTLSATSLANLTDAQLRQELGQQGRRARNGRAQQEQQHGSVPGVLLNGNNLCYCASVFHLVERIKVT